MVKNNLKIGEKYQIEATPTSGNRDFYIKCGMKYKPENQDGTYLWIEKNIYRLHLLDKYFNLIKSGKKTVEIRLNDEKRQKMKIGSYIEFINNDTNESILCEIVNKKVFESFDEVFNYYKENEIGILKKDINEVISNIYTKDEIEKNKICAIEVRKK